MSGAEILRSVRATFESILSRHDYELVELALGREGRQRVLRVTVDQPERGADLEEIAEISEEMSRALDLDDPIEGSYTLEVASPGLERPLIRPADYERFAGREVRVKCFEPIEGRRRFQGEILSAGPDSFVLKGEDEVVVEIPYSTVHTAKLVVDWDAELKRAGEKGGG